MRTATDGCERPSLVAHARRASGQAGALARMIASEQPFAAVAQQLLAVRGSLDSLLFRLVELELADRLPSGALHADVDAVLRTALGRSAAASARRRGRQHAGLLPRPGHAERTDA